MQRKTLFGVFTSEAWNRRSLSKTSIDPKHEYAPMLKAFEGVQASQYSKKLSELTLRGALSQWHVFKWWFSSLGYKRVAST